jgi:chitin disaccharide deacetylase
LAPGDAVPSVIDESGMFYGLERRGEFLKRARLDQLETEYRAQIEAAATAGLRPTHLHWHCLADGGRRDVFEMTLRLAKEYGLALRAHASASMGKLQALGLPTNDHDVLDSYSLGLDRAGESGRYVQMLRDLPDGLSE